MKFLSDNSSTRTTNLSNREIEQVIDLANDPQSRANDKLTEFADNFYVVTFENEHGYAIVSKDKRTFPVYAVLDSGRFKKKYLARS